MFEKVKAILVEELRVAEEDVTMEAELANDLGVNSLELADLILLCEEKFNIVIDDEDLHTFIAVGDKVDMGDATLTAVRCDHGEGTPHAVGLLFEIEGKKIYMMGDTAYRPDWLDDEAIKGVDLLILPINGAFGNLDSVQAAKVVRALNPKMAVPCHYWNFAQHYGSPYEFMTEMENNCPDVPYTLMRQGEGMML